MPHAGFYRKAPAKGIEMDMVRVLAFIREDAVLSKKDGGELGLANLPALYHHLVRLALDEYASDRKQDYSDEPLQEYARFMLAQIRASITVPR